MKAIKEHNRYCACGHQEINHFKNGDCMSITGEYPCGCPGFVLDSYVEFIEVDCENEIYYVRRGVDCSTMCGNPLKWKITISKNDTPDAQLLDEQCEHCNKIWDDDSASDYSRMERYAIDLALNDNPFDEDEPAPAITCIDCGTPLTGVGRLCNDCFKVVKL